jgi:hypothetical protein
VSGDKPPPTPLQREIWQALTPALTAWERNSELMLEVTATTQQMTTEVRAALRIVKVSAVFGVVAIIGACVVVALAMYGERADRRAWRAAEAGARGETVEQVLRLVRSQGARIDDLADRACPATVMPAAPRK